MGSEMSNPPPVVVSGTITSKRDIGDCNVIKLWTTRVTRHLNSALLAGSPAMNRDRPSFCGELYLSQEEYASDSRLLASDPALPRRPPEQGADRWQVDP